MTDRERRLETALHLIARLAQEVKADEFSAVGMIEAVAMEAVIDWKKCPAGLRPRIIDVLNEYFAGAKE